MHINCILPDPEKNQRCQMENLSAHVIRIALFQIICKMYNCESNWKDISKFFHIPVLMEFED